ncbi:MAG TPA: tetratricopeptide repeat protein [bacterium]|nr:tetratricopeptide repeat protein [bacterium]HOL48364.1 tetratricopeptide repeat protein [bacterium]HPQ19469.1 tetratricopeptide repeat protein [bacterium]
MDKLNFLKNKIINYLNTQKYNTAFNFLEKFFNNNDDPEYYFLVAEILKEKNFLKEAIEYYQKVLFISDKKFFIYKEIGLIYMQLNDYENALSNLAEAEKMMTDFDRELIFNIGQCLIALGDFVIAKNYFNKIFKNNKDDYLAYLGFGKLNKLEGQFKKAEKNFLKALKLEQQSIFVLENLGNLYIETGDFEKAKKIFLQILNYDEDNVLALHQLGVIEYENNNFDEAIKYYKKVIKIKPDMYDTYRELAWIYYLLGDLKNALSNIEITLKYEQDNIDAKTDYAAILYAAGFIRKAINIWQDILNVQQNNIRVINYLKKAEALKKQVGNYYSKMWLDEKTKGGFCVCGSGKRIRECCLKETDFQNYILNLSDFLKKYKKNNLQQNQKIKRFNQYLIKGKELLENGFYNEAIIELNKANEIFPNNISVLLFLSIAYYFLNDFSKAFHKIETAIEIDQQNMKPYLLLANIYEKINLFDKAIEIYQYILDNFKNKLSNEELANIHNNIGANYFQLNNIVKASIEWKKALSLNNDNINIKKNFELIKKNYYKY